MAEYIEREALLLRIDCYGTNKFGMLDEDIRAFVKAQPAADVAPVVRTRWAHLGGDEWCCPVCGFVITTEGSWDKPTKKYCEDCGAKMDGGDSDEAD
jgi:hypothetical protein|nr:MAG: hypothetical protein [Bacteriophage sp.]